MRKIGTNDYAPALYQATRNLHGADLSAVIKNFVALLAGKQMLKQAPRLVAEFERYAKRQEGIREIEITSARQLANETIQAISQAFGKKVEATEKVNDDLIGGFVVKTTDKIFDGSLRAQLVRLKQSLV